MKILKRLLALLLIIPVLGLVLFGAYLQKKVNLIDKVVAPLVKKTDKQIDDLNKKYILPKDKENKQDNNNKQEQPKENTKNKDKVNNNDKKE